MLVREPLDFAKDFVAKISDVISVHNPGRELSRQQGWWISFCITAIVITNSVCWARFERISLGGSTLAALSWMFRRSKIPWDRLLICSLRVVLKFYGITDGVLVLDDSDRSRSKSTTQISHVHKIKDKKSGGYVMGQNLVFLLFVSPKITIPVGFAFYQPDPARKAWRIKNQSLKKQGIKKRDRPAEPPKDTKYPTKQGLGLKLLEDFSHEFCHIKVKCILADALYGNNGFLSPASRLFGGVQVISQLRSNQLVLSRGRKQTVKEYFQSYPGVETTLPIRAGEEKAVVMGGARLWVNAHKAKRFVIALRYEGERENRYLIATDMTWRVTDIASAYTLRWLVEVFFSDWKQYEGWGKMAKQPGVEGSRRGLILSLLTDHALLLHPSQTALLERKLPATTVGSLRDTIRFDAIIEFMRQLLCCDNPEAELENCLVQIKQVVLLAPSSKHLNHRTLGRLEPTPSLKYRGAMA